MNVVALGCTAAGLVCLVTAAVNGARWRAGLAMMLDLFLAAGLLRMAAAPTWRRIAAAASIVVIRKVTGAGLRAGQRATSRT